MTEEKKKDLKYYRLNAEEDYMYTPISVLRYISELEQQKQPIEQKADMKTKDAERIINELINPSPDLEYIKEVNEIGERLERTMERKTSKEILPEEERDCFHMGAKTGRKDYIKALDGELLWKIKLAIESAEEEIEELKKELQNRG
jgi:hypothetical protein